METTTSQVPLLLELAREIASSLDAQDRGDRIVTAIRRFLPADAVTLLRLEGGDTLVPIAQHGLAADVLGHRFRLDEHPRLAAICNQTQPIQFPPDSPLPDPFDGMLADFPDLGHTVHACMGCSLRLHDQLQGVLCLDATAPHAFDEVDHDLLEAMAALAGAALHNAELLERVETYAYQQGALARNLSREEAARRGNYLIGRSALIESLRSETKLVGRTDLPVLLTGETGVGKEVVVRMLHAESARAEQALVYLNCAALPSSVAESELFGHEAGAFTDARKQRLGKFQVADGASLFLDEIGELPMPIQAKLLRVLQSGEVQRVGSDQNIHVDVRLFAATNRDLHAEVKAGRFRADLLHRLDVCRLLVPALRDHADDIPVLAGHFCDEIRRRLGIGPVRVSERALEALALYSWPGNVRELQNVLSRAALHASARVERGAPVLLELGDLGSDFQSLTGMNCARTGLDAPAPPLAQAIAPDPTPVGPLRPAVAAFERQMIEAALERNGGVWARAAKELGLHRSNLHHLAQRLGLRD